MINYNRVEQAAIFAKKEVMWDELQRHYHSDKLSWPKYNERRNGRLKGSAAIARRFPDNKFWQAWANFLQSEELENVKKPNILKEAEDILSSQEPEPKPTNKRPRPLKTFKAMGQVQKEAITAGSGGLFRQMPDWILRAPRPAEYKVIYAILLSYQGVKDHAWPGYDLLCEQAQVSRATLSKNLKDLARDGLLTVKRRGLGMSNRYEVFDQFKGATKGSSD